ncbi:MAG: molybdopterin molybdotransferase MoeA [Desulfobacterales bacterium]|jgi:molybdopterin molybdotransferase
MAKSIDIGLDDALRLTLERISPMAPNAIDLSDGVDRIVSQTVRARVDSPSVDASLRDGYAVVASDVSGAAPSTPVCLRVAGRMAPGGREDMEVLSGTTVRVLTGAKIPSGANAVIPDEFTERKGAKVWIRGGAVPGRHILPKGADISGGEPVAVPGDRLTPGRIGLLTAAGHCRILVTGRPLVAVVATGDEVVAPGLPLAEGKLYASNLSTISAWCRRLGMDTRCSVARDDPGALLSTLQTALSTSDALITTGGAWTGDRDRVARTLNRLDWTLVFHHVRIGPGKGVGFGMHSEKPVFILPGGPPSCLMGFLQIALPGLMRLSGVSSPGLSRARLRLAENLAGRSRDWTQFRFGTIETDNGMPLFRPLGRGSRLQSMAEAQAVVAIPEGVTQFPAGTVVSAQMLESFPTIDRREGFRG